MSLPVDPPAATDPGVLREAIEDALSIHFDMPCLVVALERRPSHYRTSHALEELDVWLEDGTFLPLMLKHLGRGALSEDARRVKPDFLDDPLREIDTYRTL